MDLRLRGICEYTRKENSLMKFRMYVPSSPGAQSLGLIGWQANRAGQGECTLVAKHLPNMQCSGFDPKHQKKGRKEEGTERRRQGEGRISSNTRVHSCS